MKNFLLITAICLLVFSCKKDEEKSPADFPFSKENVNEDKAKLEDAGQQMITEMKAMNNSESNPVLESFVDCNSLDDPFETSVSKSAPVFRTINATASVTANRNTIEYLTKMMKSDITEDPSTFQEMFDKYKGVYTWNATSKVWVKTASAEFKFLFPSTKGGTTANAALVITYTGKTGYTLLDNYSGDYPTALNAAITVGAKKVFEIDFKATYTAEGIPAAVNYFVALYPYKYEISWKYSASSLSLRYHLTNGSKNIIDCFGSVGGNFTKANVTTAMDSDDSEPTDVFSSGNAYFQVFNVKLAGTIDFKGLYQAEQKIVGDNYQAETKRAEEINKYVNLDLVFADSKQKIASVVAYPAKDIYQWYDWNNTLHTEEDYYIDMKLVFEKDELHRIWKLILM